MNKVEFVGREELEKVYVQDQNSIQDCSKILGISVGSVFNYLKKYGIPTRKTFSEKSRKKISESQKNRPYHPGHKLSEETKTKISQSHKGVYTKPTEFGGHRRKRSDGYIKVYCPDHPYSTKDGYVMEHVLVMEKEIGRCITRKEVVHHKNHKRDDNRLENLELMAFKAHAGLHMKERWQKKKEKTV